MDSAMPVWRIVHQSPVARRIAPSSIGLVLNYDGREARLSIALGEPLSTSGSEADSILAELKILYNAIGTILS
ncbi:hypothetical protein DXH78_09270 [Undibacter mobilis]|uniref:Uncharacterized protein n=1 Tax=Undibacter mobilis TaxID=2292256 RepID=A0A371BAV6_9BRAD|nr:hypothetical protein DXH78_09270 [Undibacter mobilis]